MSKRALLALLLGTGLFAGVSDRVWTAAKREHRHTPHSCPRRIGMHICNRHVLADPQEPQNFKPQADPFGFPEPKSDEQVPDDCNCQASCILNLLQEPEARNHILLSAFWLR